MTIIANNNPAEIEQLLLQLTVPDTNAVRVATKQLKKVLSKVSSVANLLCILSTSANTSCRQLSAVYLRKKIGAHWPKLQSAEKQQTQTVLLERFIQDPERQVKNAIAGVITVVAKYSLSNGGWPHLLPFLESLCKQNDATMREMSYRVFRILLSTMGKTMRAHLAILRAMFHAGLEDPALCVKTEALKALGTMAQFLDDPATLEWFQAILEPMLGALQICVANQTDSEVAILALEVLEELADDPKDVLQSKLAPIVSSVLSIAANPNVEMDVRERSAVMISSVIDHRAAALMESPALIEQLINASMTILLESCNAALEAQRDSPDDNDDDDDEDEFSSNCRGIAVQILDQCVLNLPDAFIYPRVMSAISAMMAPPNASPASRRAALFSLMVSVEGAANSMKADFQSILALVLQGLSDADSVVREAACLAIGQLSDHMTDCMTQHHVHVVQAIIACMEHPSSTAKVKRKLCLAIEAMCTELDGGACVEYAPVLMQRLFQMMQQHADKLQLLEAAINAVAAVAKNTEAAFKPFFEQTVTFLHSAMQSADENHASLKAAAMQCAGAVLLSTGETGPCLPLMQLSLDSFQSINDPAVREGAFHFWSQICQLLQADFAPYIETVVHLCLEIIDSEDGLNFKSTKADLNAEFGGGSASSEDEADQEDESLGEGTNDGSQVAVGDDDDDFEGNVRCSILSGYLDEKVAAVDCLTAICRCTGANAIKYFDHVLECFELLVEYPHENVRLVAMKGLHDLVQQARVLYPSQVEGAVSKQAQDYVDRVLPILVTLVTDDESRDVVASSLDAVLSLVLKYRVECVPVFQEHITDVVRMVKTIIDCESECDKYPIADVEKDSVLDSACDLIGGLAMAFKANFVPMLDQLMQSMMARFNKGDQLTQALLLGALGEAAEALEGAIAPALGHILQLSFNSITSDHARLRRNAAFCSGACFMAAPLDGAMASQFMNHLVQLCHHLVNVQTSDEHALAAIDNVCSALCKLITGPSAVSLSFDVDSMFKTIIMLCPLKNDMDECKFVYRTLAMLWPSVKQQPPFAVSMVQILTSAITNSELEADLKTTLAPTLQLVAKSYAKDLDLSALTPEQINVYQQALQQ